ncbi:hypothetical protein PAXRUDRAFT_656396 [Paxillus rubicundulus Ve08.2h10]|uniref:Uncharacterized protein n=1 Tax=Paxillus rubicundulus Ve08.2h10 TaxID=930991 RepID=A0A0D0BKL2_9AGAM|nr:hypothetical protein PAXRUDRAFT_656396 [Paxillus rubicundulus Ve08.2h10]
MRNCCGRWPCRGGVCGPVKIHSTKFLGLSLGVSCIKGLINNQLSLDGEYWNGVTWDYYTLTDIPRERRGPYGRNGRQH